MRKTKLRKFPMSFICILLLFLLASCNNQGQTKNAVPQMLNVELSVQPEKGKPNEPIVFEAKVTQGRETVTNADNVTFEIWRSKAKKHEQVKIKKATNGVYQLTKEFQQEGTYYIISHVTARGMHNMPKKEFTVGKPSEPEAADSSMSGMGMGEKDEQNKK